MERDLAKSEQAHAALEAAMAKLSPLQSEAKKADDAVNNLMIEFRSLTQPEPEPVRRRGAGGRGGKRGPRSVDVVAMTASTRLSNSLHADGKTTKKQAVNAALDKAGLLASARGGAVTEELKAQIVARGDGVWGKK